MDAVRESVGLGAVAEALAEDAETSGAEAPPGRKAQRAIMLSPSQPRNWRILAFVRAQSMR